MGKFKPGDTKPAVSKDIPWEEWSVMKMLAKATSRPDKQENYVLTRMQHGLVIFREPFEPTPGLHSDVQRVFMTHAEVAEMYYENR